MPLSPVLPHKIPGDIQKLIYLMKPEQIKEVWVQDQLVYKQ